MAILIEIEALTGVRYKLCMMGLDLYKKSHVLFYNKYMVWNIQLLSNSLNKNHKYVAYHKCKEAVAAGISAIGHIIGKQKMSDLLTKPLGSADYYKFLSDPLFGRNS